MTGNLSSGCSPTKFPRSDYEPTPRPHYDALDPVDPVKAQYKSG